LEYEIRLIIWETFNIAMDDNVYIYIYIHIYIIIYLFYYKLNSIQKTLDIFVEVTQDSYGYV
jgi:hypothetical protein